MKGASFALGDGSAVSGVRHNAEDAVADLVIAHGAGGSIATPQLVRIADAVATRGVTVTRFNFPYAERGRKSPGSPKEAIACYRSVAEAVAAPGRRLFIGGKSYGGRMASHLAAEGFQTDGLVFFGYPLHAPGKTDRLRDEHLGSIDAPMLFIEGTRDAFARVDLIEKTVASLPRATIHLIDGADHSFAVPGRKSVDVVEELAAVASGWITSL
ncbi:MAG: alpha/beta family hydrolase [Actinomycetota bacterium]|nr:dienelactone hydrolase family protein [Actinomycetota bacterium]